MLFIMFWLCLRAFALRDRFNFWRASMVAEARAAEAARLLVVGGLIFERRVFAVGDLGNLTFTSG